MKIKHLSLSTYATEEHLRRVITAKSDLLNFACFITHDKDVWSKTDEEKNPEHVQGTPKTTHRHVAIWLKSVREPKDIVSWFKKCLDDKGELANTRWEETRSTSKLIEYFTHSSDECRELGKYQYQSEDIKVLYGDLDSYLEAPTDYEERNRKAEALKEKEAIRKEANEESIDNMLNDIIDRKPLRYMAKSYGRDYIKNFKSYNEFAGRVYLEETGDLTKALDIMGMAENFTKQQLNIEYRKGVADGFSRLVKEFRYSDDEDARIFVEKARLLLMSYEKETEALKRGYADPPRFAHDTE